MSANRFCTKHLTFDWGMCESNDNMWSVGEGQDVLLLVEKKCEYEYARDAWVFIAYILVEVSWGHNCRIVSI
jgi:hypothetical protein